MKTMGQFIRELRENQEISLREMSRKLELSAAFLSDVELGRRFPAPDTLIEIAKLLKCDIAELQARDPRPPIDELKRIAENDPQYALALRAMVSNDVTGQELLEMLKQKSKTNRQTAKR